MKYCAAAGENDLSNQSQVAPGVGLVAVDPILPVHVQLDQPAPREMALLGKAGSRRVSSAAFVPNVQMSSSRVPNSTELRDRVDADAEHVRELAFGPALQLDALIVDLVMRVLAVPDPEAREHAADRPGLERALEFDRGASRSAPRQRDREPLADAEQSRPC